MRPASCLGCHVSYATLNVPGALVRSVATGAGSLLASVHLERHNVAPDAGTPNAGRVGMSQDDPARSPTWATRCGAPDGPTPTRGPRLRRWASLAARVGAGRTVDATQRHRSAARFQSPDARHEPAGSDWLGGPGGAGRTRLPRPRPWPCGWRSIWWTICCSSTRRRWPDRSKASQGSRRRLPPGVRATAPGCPSRPQSGHEAPQALLQLPGATPKPSMRCRPWRRTPSTRACGTCCRAQRTRPPATPGSPRGGRQAIVEILRETKSGLPAFFQGPVSLARPTPREAGAQKTLLWRIGEALRIECDSLIRLREPGVHGRRRAALDARLAGRGGCRTGCCGSWPAFRS